MAILSPLVFFFFFSLSPVCLLHSPPTPQRKGVLIKRTVSPYSLLISREWMHGCLHHKYQWDLRLHYHGFVNSWSGFTHTPTPRSLLSHALLSYSPWFLIYFVPSHYRSSLSYLRQKNIVSFGVLPVQTMSHFIIQQLTRWKLFLDTQE